MTATVLFEEMHARFPPIPSSPHFLQPLLRPLGPTPSGKGPTVSCPSNPVLPRDRASASSRRKISSAVGAVVEEEEELEPGAESGRGKGRSEWVANSRVEVERVGLTGILQIGRKIHFDEDGWEKDARIVRFKRGVMLALYAMYDRYMHSAYHMQWSIDISVANVSRLRQGISFRVSGPRNVARDSCASIADLYLLYT